MIYYIYNKFRKDDVLMARQRSDRQIEMEASVEQFIKKSPKGTDFTIRQILLGFLEAIGEPEEKEKESQGMMRNVLNKCVKANLLECKAGIKGPYGQPSIYKII
jgi:hypothetical protein